MMYNNLVFREISEYETQAAFKLEKGYSVQIIRNEIDHLHECNLYDFNGSIIDCVEGEDVPGTEYFLKISIDLIKDIEFWDQAMDDGCELIELGRS